MQKIMRHLDMGVCPLTHEPRMLHLATISLSGFLQGVTTSVWVYKCKIDGRRDFEGID